MNGRLTTAPCGHPGRVVIGTYVECLTRFCTGLPNKEHCKHCGSDKIEPFTAPNVPDGATHCLPCGRVTWTWSTDDGG